MLAALEKPDPHWFGENPTAGRDQLVRETFATRRREAEEAARTPSNGAGARCTPPRSATRWRRAAPAFAKAFNLGPFERPGDAHTPNNTRHDDKFQQVHGATYRHLFDLADWDRGLATSAPGQSGQPGSPHYADLLPLWAKGEYFPLAYSRAKVEEVTRHRLVLKP